eukprot:TRINITY_DN375_c0_g1_i2.p2 TRINITY_DN375_c0_g1~~TRINITY_DN375_c0_g1_i2.p2  ORF type:complete len:634 (+),score=165.13 TRINITY_DN375_c0_g1_i2:73-1974(+)
MVVAPDFSSPPVSPGAAAGWAAARPAPAAAPDRPAEPAEIPGREAVLAHLKGLLQPLYNRGGIARHEFVGAVKGALAEVMAGGPANCGPSVPWQTRCSHALARQLQQANARQQPAPAPAPPPRAEPPPEPPLAAGPDSRSGSHCSSSSGGVLGSVLTYEERQQQRQRQMRDWRKAQLELKLPAPRARRRPAAGGPPRHTSPASYGARHAAVAAAAGTPRGTPGRATSPPRGCRGGVGMTPGAWSSPKHAPSPTTPKATPATSGAPRRAGGDDVSVDAVSMMERGAARLEQLVRRLAQGTAGGAGEQSALCDVVLHELRNYQFYASVAAGVSTPRRGRPHAARCPGSPQPGSPGRSSPRPPLQLRAAAAAGIAEEEAAGRRRVAAAADAAWVQAEGGCAAAAAALSAAAQREAEWRQREQRLTAELRQLRRQAARQQSPRSGAPPDPPGADPVSALRAQSDRIEQLFGMLEEKERLLSARGVPPGRRRSASPGGGARRLREAATVSPPASPQRSAPRGAGSPRGGLRTPSRQHSPRAARPSPPRSSDATGQYPPRPDVVEYIRSLLQPLYNSGAMEQALFADVVRGVSQQLFAQRWRRGDDARWQHFVRQRIERLVALQPPGADSPAAGGAHWA